MHFAPLSTEYSKFIQPLTGFCRINVDPAVRVKAPRGFDCFITVSKGTRPSKINTQIYTLIRANSSVDSPLLRFGRQIHLHNPGATPAVVDPEISGGRVLHSSHPPPDLRGEAETRCWEAGRREYLLSLRKRRLAAAQEK